MTDKKRSFKFETLEGLEGYYRWREMHRPSLHSAEVLATEHSPYLEFPLTMDGEEAFCLARERLFEDSCPRCGGSGQIADPDSLDPGGTNLTPCPGCSGTGYVGGRGPG